MSSVGGSQGLQKDSQIMEELKVDNMDISASNKEVGEIERGLDMEEEEVESPVKEKLMVGMTETDGQNKQPMSTACDGITKEVITDDLKRDKQGFTQWKGKEVVLARNPLSSVDANSSNNISLRNNEKVSQLAVRRVLFRDGQKWKEGLQNKPYFVELPSDEESGDLRIFPTVNANKYEGLLIEELEKFSLKRKIEEERELTSAKRLKSMKENKVELERKGKVGRPKKQPSKGRLNSTKLVEVPILEAKSGSRFDILADLPEDFVFSATGRSGGRPETTTQGL